MDTPLISSEHNAVSIELLVKQLKTRVGVVPFVGAGMSVPFGFPAWRAFLESQAPDGSVRQRIEDLLNHGQYEEAAEVLLEVRGESAFEAALEHTFSAHRLPDPLPPAAILQLPCLCSGPVLTTNFDHVLERVFENARQPFEECILGMRIEALREAFHHNRRVLVKLHGDADDPTSRVLTLRDYERAYGEHEPLAAFLRFAMTRPLLFLGCSLRNDRTVRVLEMLARELRGRRAEGLQIHYAIVEHLAQEPELALRNRRFAELGIRPIWYPPGRHEFVADLMSYLVTEAGRPVVCGAVPAAPPHYLLRSAELTELRAMVLGGGSNPVAITGPDRGVGVQGLAGVGKTVLAAALTRDSAVQIAYPDGIFWLTVTSQPNLLALLNQLARWLPDCEGPLTTEIEAQTAVRNALTRKRALLILDDVWSLDDVSALNVMSAPGQLLVTTRKRDVLVSLNARVLSVDVLTPEAALQMLADWTGESDAGGLPAVAADVARECGYLPLALAMVGAMTRVRSTAWADVLALLRRRDLQDFRKAFPDYPYPTLLRAIGVSVDDLVADDQSRYLDLAVFPEDQPIPEAPLQILWNLSPAQTRLYIDRLVTRSLATRQYSDTHSTILLHDLQYDYVRKLREEGLPALHTRLVAGYREKCRAGWASGPNDGYFFETICWHLAALKRWDELEAVLCDLDFVEAKCSTGRIDGLMDDFVRLIETGAHLTNASQFAFVANVFSAVLYTSSRLYLWQSSGARRVIPHLPSQEVANYLVGTDRASPVTVLGLTQNPDGKRLLLQNSVPNMLLTCKRRIVAHDTDVFHVAMSPDGRYVVSLAYYDTRMRLANLETGRLAGDLDSGDGTCVGAEFTFDGKEIIGAFDDGHVERWTRDRSLEESHRIAGLNDGISALAVSPIDYRVVVAGGAAHANITESGGRVSIKGHVDGTIYIFDFTTKSTRRLRGHESAVIALAFSPAGDLVASSSYDGTVRLWDLRVDAPTSRTVVTVASLDSDEIIRTLCFAKGGKLLACFKDDEVLLVHTEAKSWSRAKAILPRSEYLQIEFVGGALSPDGSLIATARGNSSVHLWDATTGRPIIQYTEAVGETTNIRFSPDGKQFAVGSGHGEILIYDTPVTRSENLAELDPPHIEALAISPNGSLLLAGSAWGRITLWRSHPTTLLETLREIDDPDPDGQPGHIKEACFSQNGRLAACVSEHGRFYLWCIEGERATRLDTRGLNTTAISEFSPDSRLLNCGPEHAWFGARTNRRLGYHLLDLTTLQLWKPSVKGYLFTPDGSHLLSVNPDNNILELWAVKSSERVSVFQLPAGSAYVKGVAPDGTTIAVALDRSTLLIDVEARQVKKELAIGAGDCRSFAFSADGRYCAVGGDTGGVRLIALTNGLAECETWLLGRVMALRFSSDGLHLWAADDGRATGRPSFYIFRVAGPDVRLVNRRGTK